MKTLYFDCFAGASGNMILGALVALGVDEKMLVEELKKLNTGDFDIEFSTKDKSGISAIHAEVKVPPEHAHRHLHTIEKIINDSSLNDSVKKRAIEIFTNLAEAEAKIHGIDVQKVHFHEVGAMDAIVDVVGACVGFEMLGIEKFACSKIHVGSGFAKMAHGKFPIPPPAVAELLQNAPIYSTEIEGELITPTGAAIIATVCDSYGQIPEMKIEKTAYGAGTREYKDFPNALRLILGETNSSDFGQNTYANRQNIPVSGQKTDDNQSNTSNNRPNTNDNPLNTDDNQSNTNNNQSDTHDSRSNTSDNQSNTSINRKNTDAIEENTTLINQNTLKVASDGVADAENDENFVSAPAKVEVLTLLETNLDDISAETLGFVMERAFEIGCLDCWFTPIQMKKNRPATMLSILCDAEKQNALKELIYTETTTLGIRISKIERECLEREIVKVETKFGAIDVKVSKRDGKIVNAKPEYEQIRQIALQSKKSLREIEREILENIQAETRV